MLVIFQICVSVVNSLVKDLFCTKNSLQLLLNLQLHRIYIHLLLLLACEPLAFKNFKEKKNYTFSISEMSRETTEGIESCLLFILSTHCMNSISTFSISLSIFIFFITFSKKKKMKNRNEFSNKLFLVEEILYFFCLDSQDESSKKRRRMEEWKGGRVEERLLPLAHRLFDVLKLLQEDAPTLEESFWRELLRLCSKEFHDGENLRVQFNYGAFYRVNLYFGTSNKAGEILVGFRVLIHLGKIVIRHSHRNRKLFYPLVQLCGGHLQYFSHCNIELLVPVLASRIILAYKVLYVICKTYLTHWRYVGSDLFCKKEFKFTKKKRKKH